MSVHERVSRPHGSVSDMFLLSMPVLAVVGKGMLLLGLLMPETGRK